MNTAISRFLSTLKQPCLRLRAIWCLPLGVLVSLIIASAPSIAQYAQSGGVLQPSDQGEAVLDLQQRLSDLGYYSGPVTGYFDTTTQQAVSRFQQENGLAPDGIVGTATGSILYSGSRTSANPAVGNAAASGSTQLNDAGTSVTELQQQLAQMGYYTGAVTGVFDNQTQSAVMSFQRDRGLSADGIVGSATQAALYQSPATTSTGTTYTPSETSSDGLLQLGDAGAEVSNLQSQLQALGYYDGPISGSFGSQTQSALIAFQQAQGLTADGIAGPRVSTALSSSSSTVAAAPQTTVAPQTVTSQTATPQIATSQTIAPQTAVQPAVQSTIAPTSTTLTTPQVTTTPVAPSELQTTPIPSGIVQVPPVAPSAVLPPPSPQAAPVAMQPSGSSSNPPMMRSNLESGRFSITELQRRLQMRGYDLGDMTGVYDSTTQDAILQAQQSYGLSPSDLGE